MKYRKKPIVKKCPDCGLIKNASEFYVQKSGKLTTYCKECNKKRSSARYKENKDKCREEHRKWVLNNPEKVAFTKAKSAYGITKQQWDSMPRICQICGSTEHLVIDHNHQSGRIRGMLCSSCNSGIGFLKDNPCLLERAADYVLGIAKELKPTR